MASVSFKAGRGVGKVQNTAIMTSGRQDPQEAELHIATPLFGYHVPSPANRLILSGHKKRTLDAS
jgi:hypothetical protein